MSQITRPTRILIVDLIGLAFDAQGHPDPSEVRHYIDAQPGCRFVDGACSDTSEGTPDPQTVSFHYCPEAATRSALLDLAGEGRYDAVIAAATFIPPECRFELGGVRIGAGTGNMASASWGGANGLGGTAPLMNTPGINSVATAQMVWKALMRIAPDLPLEHLHNQVVTGQFVTGRDLHKFPTRKLEGRKMAVIGFGNIGREVARLAQAFRMKVTVFARPHHAERIAAEGFAYASSIEAAATGAEVLSVHLGLGPMDETRGVPANTGLIGRGVFDAMAPGSILINFDRGELVECGALGGALDSDRVSHAAIDADVFRDAETGALSGPMVPYLDLATRFGDRLCLLPHAAADTDHPTRVAGAKQAVDQILAALRRREIRNPVGEIPEGYQSARSN